MRAHRFRFYPTPRQERLLAREFGAARWVFNYGLEEISRGWRERQERLSINAVSRRITVLKRTVERSWLKEGASTVLTQSLRDLNRAFSNFFEKRARYPHFKKRRAAQSVRYQLDPRQKGTYRAGTRLVLPKLGELRIVWSRVPGGRPLMVSVSRDAIHRYFVSFAVDDPILKLPLVESAVGIDVGLISAVALSDGRKMEATHHLRRRLRTLRRRGRALDRKTLGSKRRERARRELAKAHARVNDSRQDSLHKLTTSLVRDHQTLAVEDLNVAGMVRNRKVALALADGALSEFHRQLEYKAAWYGRTLLRVGRFFPSTKRCSVCGFVLAELKLSVREWTCPNCGTAHDRDVNAARNILQEGLRVAALPPGGRELRRVEGAHPRPYAGRPAKRESHGIEVQS